jgi:SAM-dependent methyltransferase
VLDAPCGFGRNSLFLAEPGYKVIGADTDRERIRFVASRARNDPRLVKKNLSLAVCDLQAQSLPFADASYGTLLIVHFIPEQWSNYLALLRTGGYLLFETMGGQGGNYLQLPRVGHMRALLGLGFRMSFYRERPVGPPEAHAVTVRLVARKI